MDTPGHKTPPVMNPLTHRAGSSHLRSTNIVAQLASDRAQRGMMQRGQFNTGNAPVLTKSGNLFKSLFSR